MNLETPFRPRARLLLQLGDQLIKTQSIALLELVKNSYDALAKKASITMKNLDSDDEGFIVIEDDGIGMDIDTIRDVWMHPGTEHKQKILEERTESNSTRMPIGGKGIGRFGAHKLGYKIELISKTNNKKEVKVNINWKDFEKDAFLDDVTIKISESEIPEVFKENKTGTRIVISDLKGNWSRSSIREIYRSINSLNSPFESRDSFKTFFRIDNQEILKNLTEFEEIKDSALYEAEVDIFGSEIEKLTYKFKPWDSMTKLSKREIINKGIPMVYNIRDQRTRKLSQEIIDLSNFNIGRIKLKLLIFDRTSKILSLGMKDKKGFKEYLDKNGGIRVYRDGIRVYDYGEPGNDWLQLDLMRINQPGKKISNNIIIGAVYIDRVNSFDLVEKTNREGFIENDAYKSFEKAIKFSLEKILSQRNIDKDIVRKFYSPTSQSEPVIGKLKAIYDLVSEKVSDKNLEVELKQAIKSIQKDYKHITEIYTKSSSAGLSLSIVIHEIIHMIDELAHAVDSKEINSRVKYLVKTLQKTANDYSGVIKQSKKSKTRIGAIVLQALTNVEFRIKAHKIIIVDNFSTSKFYNLQVELSESLILSTLINLIDNSMWWLEYGKVTEKKIYIDIVEGLDNRLTILLADNGPGFSIPPEEIVKPFISDKPGGMGLGLHLASEILNSHKGLIDFPEFGDYDIPDEFKNGAIIALTFPEVIK
ncbi:histidine kinase/DNA gyrase B/HSP90-like ATPase [Idiomarina loihiensis]|uniref:ATP-binding protein n=1 Tax=Idiomarina TaxID=135575 RepID=UPI000D71D127|nr:MULTISPECIES: ATP-binding protein [Idiomarina]PWW38566.1 histidine kinase/DNA gyrase B/HSP90-like ATPase [Idiomarina loihiensis]TDP48360.1 histidine kinase/DNA gyrase B/HSP90-like ATPase [Idiomarina loihiensis]TDS23526.1 histidine kinase/DNA gyrase B/HSP90-like ATPase [Idiomarina sp. H2]